MHAGRIAPSCRAGEVSVVLLLGQAAATLFMTGVIWIVQSVHYPLFALVGRDGFSEYAREHRRRITVIVGIVMPVEAVTAVLTIPTQHGVSKVLADTTTDNIASQRTLVRAGFSLIRTDGGLRFYEAPLPQRLPD